MTRTANASAAEGPETNDAAVHAALASAIRRQALAVLDAATEPLDAASLATALRVHVSTARFHLDHLEAAGLVQREPTTTRAGRRGRPRVHFLAAPRHGPQRSPHQAHSFEKPAPNDVRDQLISVLASMLTGQAATIADETVADETCAETVAERAEHAGRQWAQALAEASPGEAPGTDLSPRLTSVLTELGFDPVADADSIRLRSCPFRAAAEQFPEVVCAVHRGLVDEFLSAEQRQRGVRLLPLVQPGLCIVGTR